MASNEKLIWLDFKDSLRVGDRHINRGLSYVSQKKPRISEPSCVNLALHLGNPDSEFYEPLGYCPDYFDLTPDQRAKYLDWLEAERETCIDEIGYVFLFFYGLERRVIHEKHTSPQLLTQVSRLLRDYSESRSFMKYSLRFLTFSIAQDRFSGVSKGFCARLLEREVQAFTIDTYKAALGLMFSSGYPLRSNMAYELVRLDENTSSSVWIKRFPAEHRDRFISQYKTLCPNGLSLIETGKPLELEYNPGNLSLCKYRKKRARVPRVQLSSMDMNTVREIWLECIEEIKRA